MVYGEYRTFLIETFFFFKMMTIVDKLEYFILHEIDALPQLMAEELLDI